MKEIRIDLEKLAAQYGLELWSYDFDTNEEDDDILLLRGISLAVRQ